MKTTPNTPNFNPYVLEAATVMRYGRLRPVIDERKCISEKTRFIDPNTINTPNSANLCITDKSAKGEFMYLTVAGADDLDKIVCHISVSNLAIKEAFSVARITEQHLQAVYAYLEHLVKCRFYYEYEYKRTPLMA